MVRVAVLLFELGTLQVFHYQTLQERDANKEPYIIHWQDTQLKRLSPQFNTIWEAMADYTKYTRELREAKAVDAPPKLNVIFVDFKTRKRMA